MSDPLRRRFHTPASSGSSGTRPATRDARGFQRAPLPLELVFEIPGEEPVRAVSRDISLGGMFIETPAPAAFGSRLVVTLLTPTRAASVSIACIVRWTTDAGMGVQFLEMGARDTHELTQLLAGV